MPPRRDRLTRHAELLGDIHDRGTIPDGGDRTKPDLHRHPGGKRSIRLFRQVMSLEHHSTLEPRREALEMSRRHPVKHVLNPYTSHPPPPVIEERCARDTEQPHARTLRIVWQVFRLSPRDDHRLAEEVGSIVEPDAPLQVSQQGRRRCSQCGLEVRVERGLLDSQAFLA